MILLSCVSCSVSADWIEKSYQPRFPVLFPAFKLWQLLKKRVMVKTFKTTIYRIILHTGNTLRVEKMITVFDWRYFICHLSFLCPIINKFVKLLALIAVCLSKLPTMQLVLICRIDKSWASLYSLNYVYFTRRLTFQYCKPHTAWQTGISTLGISFLKRTTNKNSNINKYLF